MLKILEGYDFSNIEFGSVEHLHVFTEAKKLAFEDRAKYYADPSFNELDYRALLSEEYAAKRRDLIGARASRRVDAGKLEQGNTIYLTVSDSEGNMFCHNFEQFSHLTKNVY